MFPLDYTTRIHFRTVGPLLVLLYVNDLKNTSSVLDPIMAWCLQMWPTFPCPFRHTEVNIFNDEWRSINQWFTSNKLSLNAKKQKILVSINPVKTMSSLLHILTKLTTSYLFFFQIKIYRYILLHGAIPEKIQTG